MHIDINDKLTAILLVGAPGSGKSTWGKNFAAQNSNIVRLCPDEFRAKFGWGEGDQSVSAQAFDATRNGMDIALKEGKSVIIDATNMYRKTRKDFINIAKKYNATTIAIVFELSKDELIKRNKKRQSEGGRNVPENIIDRMLNKYERPSSPEFDKVIFIS